MKLRYLPLLLLPLATQAETNRQTYTCDNGSRIDISFTAPTDGRPQATLHFGDEDVVLPMVPTASGTRYRADPISLHTKEDEAVFEDGSGNFRRCRLGLNAPGTPGQTAATASSFIEVSGSITYLVRMALPPGAILILRIQDTARADAPARTLVEQRYELNGAQAPIPFSATVDRDLIGKRARLTASARIEHQGRLLLISDRAYPLLKEGHPAPVSMILKPAARQRP
jgi:putative lipoprotein